MSNLAFRQIHLDFHTSEEIDGIGSKFSKIQFQETLKLGHVNSITVFSKCHHGWAYHPSKANEMHPGLKFDLLGAMIEAAHEIGVKTPVYISAGLDEKMARRHPDWLVRDDREKTTWVEDFMSPGYHVFCFNSPYLEYLLTQIEEVVRNYDADGLFLDITGVRTCYCQNCIASLRKEGKDPRDAEAVRALGESVYMNYMKRVNELVHSIKPGMRIFHNGSIRMGRRDLACMNTHIEIESLPTGGWGYDHFPLNAHYQKMLGLDMLGMTGKFHTSWGEFGGYKHPNALRYETALSLANGARCSVGDQLHPLGVMDAATYSLIGTAYKEVEEKEAWCADVTNIADVAILSLESRRVNSGIDHIIEAGAARILLEGNILFDVIDIFEDFNKYKVIILADRIRIDNELKKKLEAFLNEGGKILATGESGLNMAGDEFELDMGAKWLEPNPFKPDYFRPAFKLGNLEPAAFVCYTQGQKVELEGGTELGKREDPYFNRDVFKFCSHRHTPNSLKYGGPGMVESRNGIYIAWNVFEDYAKIASLFLKETVLYALKKLMPERSIETNLPAQGVVTLMQQKDEKRYVNHLLYASPVRRGESIEVIEDIIPIYDVKVTVHIPELVKKVYLAPQMEEIGYTQNGNDISYVVKKLECHQMVVINY